MVTPAAALVTVQIQERRRAAAHLHLTEATIKGYVSRVLTRLGCTNQTEAALLAQRAGLVTYE
ncbi:LuxR C-terminal-related transcriptional regulator [Micromonospora sp. NPDC051543]|uniref:LuxR C-terminal-related transcriptional regulator n=1 Tax=Micromonospora sp. NPDC051543 TaxID=3364287 RepID=UPI0037994EDC